MYLSNGYDANDLGTPNSPNHPNFYFLHRLCIFLVGERIEVDHS